MKTALVFSVGVLAGYATCNTNSNNKTEKLKAETKTELSNYITDIKYDLFEGNMLHKSGEFYIHQMELFIKKLNDE